MLIHVKAFCVAAHFFVIKKRGISEEGTIPMLFFYISLSFLKFCKVLALFLCMK
jgi:hypothetical protein